MANQAQNRSRMLPARYVRSVIQFALIGKDVVEVTDFSHNITFKTTESACLMLLQDSYRNREGTQEILWSEEEQKFDRCWLFDPSTPKCKTYTGYFPYDQLIMLMYGTNSHWYCDQSLRHKIILNNEVYYLAIVSEKQFPVATCCFEGPREPEDTHFLCEESYKSHPAELELKDCSMGVTRHIQ